MTRSTIMGLLLVVACKKDVPLATIDATPATTDATADATTAATTDAPTATSDAAVIDPACSTQPQNGDPCSVLGQECTWSTSCGENTAVCLVGTWLVNTCDVATQHCPCVSNSDCDPLSQCAADGVCQPLLTMSGCGASGQACCGGTCGSCELGLACDAGTCM
jgi:hypothetical protein